MAPFKVFALDDWVYKYRPLCRISLSSSCIEPLSLAQLQAFDPSKPIIDNNAPLSYGPTRGLPSLRQNISDLYNGAIEPEDTLVTAGAIAANFLVLETLVEPGDHIIVQHSTYLQLKEIPRRAGAEVELWKWRWSEASGRWEMDFEELRAILRPETKMIVLTNPSNPSGAVMGRKELETVIEIAKEKGVMVMCDEVFRFLHHDEDVQMAAPPSVIELGYENSIVTGSVSKAFALPGVRCGWVAVSSGLRDPVLDRIAQTRDYTTITVSQVDQQIASFALESKVKDQILTRSTDICRTNLSTIRSWAKSNRDWVTYMPPSGGGTCLVQIKDHATSIVDDAAFAEALAREQRVCAPPAGRCFGYETDGAGATDLKGCLRIGIVTEGDVLMEGLRAIERLRRRWK